MNPSSDALPLVRCRDCNSSLLQPLRADRIDDDSSCVTRACPDCGRQDTGGRWLVAPYGAVGWVRNARAAGRIELRDEAAGVLQACVRNVRVVRPYFDAAPGDALAAFAAEISRHPVFRLRSPLSAS